MASGLRQYPPAQCDQERDPLVSYDEEQKTDRGREEIGLKDSVVEENCAVGL